MKRSNYIQRVASTVVKCFLHRLLDVIDISVGKLVASVDVLYQPGGIGFWKMEGSAP